MGRPSKVDQLPGAIREVISDLRAEGHTVDQILDHLRSLLADGQLPSRSGLHRHIQGLDQLAEKLQRSRSVAEALVRKLGDAPESRQARLNIELMHTVILDLQMAAESGQSLNDPEQIMFLAKSLDHLAKAAKGDADLTFRIAEEASKKATAKAAKAMETVARERGLTADTINAIKSGILGIKAA